MVCSLVRLFENAKLRRGREKKAKMNVNKLSKFFGLMYKVNGLTNNRNNFMKYFEVIQSENDGLGAAAFHPHHCESLLTTLMTEPSHILGCAMTLFSSL